MLKSLALLLALVWMQFPSGLLLREVVAPVRTVSSYGSSVVVMEVRIDRNQRPVPRILSGDNLAAESALQAVRSWSFAPLPGSLTGITSVTFFFRPAIINPVKPEIAQTLPTIAQPAYAAVPKEIVDPGYPATCLGGGAVTLEVQIDASGSVTKVHAISGPGAFTEDAEQAVKRWKFVPARLEGIPVASLSYVVISFVRPLT
jgi:TonB family protein